MSDSTVGNLGTIIWLEDEPDLLLAEEYDLKTMGYAIKPFALLGSAFDWVVENREAVRSAFAMLVDVTMPHRDDMRFYKDDGTPGGAVFCQRLKEFAYWSELRPRILLYTRLPLGDTYYKVERFANEENLRLVRKGSGSRIAVDLINTRIVGDG